MKNCAECRNKVCVFEDSTDRIKLKGGSDSVDMSLCGYDGSQKINIKFSLTSSPKCDPNGLLVPKMKSIAQKGNKPCIKDDPCFVTVTFDAPIDWAVALKPPKNLLASVDSADSPVSVAEFSGEAFTILTTSETAVGVCGNNINVQASGLSLLDSCNTVSQICRATATASACLKGTESGAATLTNTKILGDQASAQMFVSSAFPCDAVTGSTPYVYIDVKVGDADVSPLTKVAKIGKISLFLVSCCHLNALQWTWIH